jgi:serine/threonine protein kinase
VRVAVWTASTKVFDHVDLDSRLEPAIGVLAEFSHPALLKVHEYMRSDREGHNLPTIITEDFTGGTLDDLIRDCSAGRTPPGWNETRRLIILYGIAVGMKYLHDHRVPHG